jgi:hypothetical protein
MRLYIASLALFTLLPVLAAAQSLTPPYLPRQCEADALRIARDSMPDARVISIATFAASIPIGPVEVSIGFSPRDGRSGLWIYLLYSESLDSLKVVPMTRLFSCSDVSALLPFDLNDVSPELESTAPIPANYLQGQDLINRLASNSTFAAYRVAFPDSIPSFAALTIVPEIPENPDEPSPFPPGSPVWFIVFTGATGPENMTCAVHAIDGTVECFGAPSSVNEAAHAGTPSVGVMPNPATDRAMIMLPDQWMGKRVDVVVVDATGRQVSSFSTIAAVPTLLLPTHHLSNGAYSISLTSGNEVARTMLSVVR